MLDSGEKCTLAGSLAVGLAWTADAAVPAAIVAFAVPEDGEGVAAAPAFTCEIGGFYKRTTENITHHHSNRI